ncbi:MAG: MerR family transcriptional regulator [Pseudomonadota bacterium]
MNTEIANDEYKIGAVSRITGIGTETLRAWERRYKAVVPRRSTSGDRVYSTDDLSKLFLLKNLVDAGNAISSIANLTLEQLKDKWEKSVEISGNKVNNFTRSEDHALNQHQKCRVLLIGEDFPLRVVDGMSDFEGVEIVGELASVEQCNDYRNELIHVAIIEKPTVNEATRQLVSSIIQTTGAWHVVVLYGFGTQKEISQLQSPQVSTIRSSIDVYELARLCMDRAGGDPKYLISSKSGTVFLEESLPTRRYSAKQLESLTRISSSIQCECPKHLSDLIKSLVAFEIYSAECENKNTEDADLHSFLHATTAQSRAILEDALSHVIAHEKIEV